MSEGVKVALRAIGGLLLNTLSAIVVSFLFLGLGLKNLNPWVAFLSAFVGLNLYDHFKNQHELLMEVARLREDMTTMKNGGER